MSLTAYVNGEFLPLENAVVHIEDRGFQFADGVYEVVACLGGRFLDLGPHLERLQRSCDAIELPLPCPLSELEALVRETYGRNTLSDAMLYIQITRGKAPRSHAIADDVEPSLIITARELPRPSDEKITSGFRGITLDDLRWKRCDIKSIALLASVIGKQEAKREGADEAFWLDAEGHVLEGCSTNIFAVIDGVLVTHPIDHQILGGITRDMAIRVAKNHGLKVEERPWQMSEANLTECMMSSTTNTILPLCFMNHKAIGNGEPGAVSLQLRELILQELDKLKA
ncbi:MAG: aminotransferase class IV [Mariprofundaceae bacterium]